MRILIVLLLFWSVAAAETGGLEGLPYPPGTEKVRPSILANSAFRGTEGWRLPGGFQYDPAVSRRTDGSGSLRISGVGAAEAVGSTTISLPQLGKPRVFRLRAWLRANGTLDASARFRVYLLDSTHGGVKNCGNYVSLAGLGGTWKEYTTDLGADACMYVHVEDNHASDTLTFTVRASNIPSGVNVWLDDVTFEPVVRDLVLFPTYPNYRGMLWDDQGTETKWKVVVDPLVGVPLSDLGVRVDVVRASDEAVVDVINVPDLAPVNESGPWVSYSVTDMSYEAGGLSYGAHLFRARLLRKSTGRELYQYPDYRIVKEQPAAQRDGWKVWVDKHNRVVLNGEPTFLWGAYARFTAARNTFPAGARGSATNPDTYRSIANGCNTDRVGAACNESIPAITPWSRTYGLNGSTFLKQMAEAKMNALTVHAGYGTRNIGFDSPWAGASNPASGRITSSSRIAMGDGTRFGAEVLIGDAIRVNRPGTGVILNNGYNVTGIGTRFLSEVAPGDMIGDSIGGNRVVREVHSNTSLTISGTSAPKWVLSPFSVAQFRRVQSLTDKYAVLDAPFLPDVRTALPYFYERCAPERYRESLDQIAAFQTALRDHNIWYWHIASNIHGVGSGYWSYTPFLFRCHLVDESDSAEFMTAFRPYEATDGFLGFYLSDEPSFADRVKGLEPVWKMQRGQQRAGRGGLNFWVDGGVPRHAFDQWNTVTDAIVPDPYPATGDALPLFDDYAFGLSSWNKHGRSYWWPRRSASAVFDSRPLINTIQLFSWRGATTFLNSSFPQPSDMKIQLIASLAAGANGILWWQMGSGSGSLGDRREEEYARFQRAAKVIADLLPILKEPVLDLTGRQDGEEEYGKVIRSISDPRIKCSSRKQGARALLACTNTTNDDVTASITLTSAIQGSVKLPWNSSLITPSGDRFEALFRGLNGGQQRPGTGLLTVSGESISCASSCRFLSELAPMDTVTVKGRTRMVTSVDSDQSFRVDISPGSSWNGQSFTYSRESEKEGAAHIFLLDLDLRLNRN